MDSTSPFLYYNPESKPQSSRAHGQFVSHPPHRDSSIKSANPTSPPMPFASPAMVYPSRPSSAHSHLKGGQSFTITTPQLTTSSLSPDALLKSTGLLTPSSPTLLAMDGPHAGDMYFYPTPTTEYPPALQTPTPHHSFSDDDCIAPLSIQLPTPSTPEMWRERMHTPVSPGTSLADGRLRGWPIGIPFVC